MKNQTDIEVLLATARGHGLRVTAQAGRLIVRGPAATDPGLVQGLLDHKSAVLQVLLRPSPDECLAWEERAAIAEFDGRLPRAEAETLAWAELQAGRAADDSANSPAIPTVVPST